jgi:hypothetical protein
MPTEVVETIGSGKTHTDAAAWELATRGNLVTADEVRIGEFYGQVTSANILYPRGATTGTTVDATRFRWLRPAAGEGYDPVADTGAKMIRTAGGTNVRLQEEFFRFGACGSDRGAIGVYSDITTSGTASRCIRVDRNCWVDAVFAEFLGGTNGGNMIIQVSVGLTSGDFWLTNSIVVGSNNQTASLLGARFGIRTEQASGTANVYVLNCSAFQVKQGIAVFGSPNTYWGIGVSLGARTYCHNVASLESGDETNSFDFVAAATPLGESHNISGDSSSAGTGSQTSAIAARLWIASGSNDFRPHLTLSSAINTGKDISSEWPENPELDFLGTAHNGDGYGYEVGPFNFDTSASPDPASGVGVSPDLALDLTSNPEGADAVASGAPVALAASFDLAPADAVAVGPELALLIATTIDLDPSIVTALAPTLSLLIATGITPAAAIALATAPNLSAALDLFPDPADAVAVGSDLALLFEVAAPRVAFELRITQTAALSLLISRLVGTSATVGRTSAQSLELSRRPRRSEIITRTKRTSSLR